MRTMKRVAAVALSVVVLMTSGVSAKAAVTDVQPAKSSSEAVLKWKTKVGEEYDQVTWANNTLSRIKLVGNYIYAADDHQHRVVKIDKKTGKIVKEHKYYDENYIQHYVGNITYGEGKIFVEYNQGKIQAFDADTLESLWITETTNNAISSELTYTDGKLYFGTYSGVYPDTGSNTTYSYYTLNVKDEDIKNQYEEKKITKIIDSEGGSFNFKKGIVIGNYILISDSAGKIFSIDKKTDKVIDEKQFGEDYEGNVYERFRGNMAYDESSHRIFFMIGINDLYGVKIADSGKFEETQGSVKVYDTGYSATTPEVYNGKVYVSGTKGNPFNDPGYMAVVDVNSKDYKVNYTVELPGYSQAEPTVVTNGTDSVKVYFTVNNAPGAVYAINDSKGATTSELETIYEPSDDAKNSGCQSPVIIDTDGTIYYTNDSKYLFAVGKKAAETVKPTESTAEEKPATKPSSNATTTVVNETKVKPVTKTVKSTRSVKLTWKKNKSAKGYVIYAKAGKGKYKKVTTVGKKTSKTIKVNKDSSYKFKVKPYKLTKKNKKKYFKAYAAKAKFGSKTVKVTFKNVTGSASYKVEMKAGKAAYKTVKTTTKGGTITYTKKKAKVGTTYKFRLKGINKVNGKTVSVVIK